ncbi:hypothetical protein [Mesorhizobium sp.]|uniref:hypothetical protein n=1 Tax=Mesorhizobium sp. TaxID=1871066 RepID=UPI003422AAA6
MTETDRTVSAAMNRELHRQRDEIELIASENIVSRLPACLLSLSWPLRVKRNPTRASLAVVMAARRMVIDGGHCSWKTLMSAHAAFPVVIPAKHRNFCHRFTMDTRQSGCTWHSKMPWNLTRNGRTLRKNRGSTSMGGI